MNGRPRNHVEIVFLAGVFERTLLAGILARGGCPSTGHGTKDSMCGGKLVVSVPTLWVRIYRFMVNAGTDTTLYTMLTCGGKRIQAHATKLSVWCGLVIKRILGCHMQVTIVLVYDVNMWWKRIPALLNAP